jgi:hypothetical protein
VKEGESEMQQKHGREMKRPKEQNKQAKRSMEMWEKIMMMLSIERYMCVRGRLIFPFRKVNNPQI